MHMFKNTVGKKIVMSVTGMSLIAFILLHLMGNLTLFSGPAGINAYSAALHRFGSFVLIFRLIIIAMFSLHVFYGIQLTLENRVAKPQAYAVRQDLSSTFAGKNMIWTGLLIAAFLCYHLLQFTFQVTDPGIAAGRHMDAMDRPDVFMMVVLSFRKSFISAGYIFFLACLGLHLSHSIQSSLQTLGLHSEKAFPLIVRGGTIMAILIFLGFISIPLVVLSGLVK
jgi:succinate dehydrogenase / fumarate reductase cytochrome b subunit